MTRPPGVRSDSGRLSVAKREAVYPRPDETFELRMRDAKRTAISALECPTTSCGTPAASTLPCGPPGAPRPGSRSAAATDHPVQEATAKGSWSLAHAGNGGDRYPTEAGRQSRSCGP